MRFGWKKTLTTALFVFLVVSAFGRPLLQGFIPGFLGRLAAQEDRFAKDYIALLMAGDFKRAEDLLVPEVEPKDREALPLLGGYLNQMGGLTAARLLNVTYSQNRAGQAPVKVLTYYGDFQKGSLLLQVALLQDPGGYRVSLFKYQVLDRSFRDTFRFPLEGIPFVLYLWLALAAAMAGLTLWALGTCLFGQVRRKWLWIPFILAGVGKFTLVWGPSAQTLVPQAEWWALRVLGGGLEKASIFEPWTVRVSLPLGAILFLFVVSRIGRDGGFGRGLSVLRGWLRRERGKVRGVPPAGVSGG